MLIDTQAILWFAMNDPRLSLRASHAIANETNHYSLATIWEAAIKSGQGKLDLMRGMERISARDFFQWIATDLEFTLLPITLTDVANVEHLPLHHKDPFDRLLISQVLGRDLEFVSADTIFDQYGVRRVW